VAQKVGEELRRAGCPHPDHVLQCLELPPSWRGLLSIALGRMRRS
jgi:hypothetical protein